MRLAFFYSKVIESFARVVKFTKILLLEKYFFSKYNNTGFLKLFMVAY